MADDNKIQFDIELNEGSIDSSFKAIDDRAVKSAKSSAAVFGEYFQKQEQDLQASIERIVSSTKKVAEKSAKESAAVFGEQFKKQDEIYKASVKHNLDLAIEKITGSDGVKKSAKDSASVFEEAFAKEIKRTPPLELPPFEVPKGLLQADSFGEAGAALTAMTAPLTAVAAGVAVVTAGFVAAGYAAKQFIDYVVAGENEIKVDKKFNALAESAGVAADVLKNKLLVATKDMVGETELLNVASETFVRLGNNAKALPHILELARKTYATFGGTVLENTDKITSAIFSGQTRQLRGIGILIDTETVYKNYARALGTVVPLLTEQQKQTALLNAVLEKGNEKFKSVSSTSGQTDEAIQRLKSAFTNLNDQLSILAATSAGKTIAGILEDVTSFLKKSGEVLGVVNAAPNSLEKVSGIVKILGDNIADAERKLKSYGSVENFLYGDGVREQLNASKKALVTYQKQLEELTAAKIASDKKAAESAAKNDTNKPPSDEFIRRKQELNLKVIELDNQLRASAVQLAQDDFSRKQNSINADKLYYQQKLQANETFNQQQKQLEKFYTENGVVDETLRQQGREDLEQAHLNRMLQLQLNYAEQKKTIFYEGETQAISAGEAFNSVLEGMNEQARATAASAAKSFKALGVAMFNTIGNAAGQAFAAFGRAIAEGSNALEAFGKSLLNSLGQAAIQMGSLFILQGIAYTWAGLANGPTLIAAGAALAAAGGILSVSAGTGPSRSSGGGGGTAGADFSSPIASNTINEPIAIQDTIAQTPQTAVSVTIQGNVLDRRETGLEIARILEEQFAEQGLVIKGA